MAPPSTRPDADGLRQGADLATTTASTTTPRDKSTVTSVPSR
jgi:hypothetical protein